MLHEKIVSFDIEAVLLDTSFDIERAIFHNNPDTIVINFRKKIFFSKSELRQ